MNIKGLGKMKSAAAFRPRLVWGWFLGAILNLYFFGFCFEAGCAQRFSSLRREMIIRMMQTMKPRAQMGPAVLMHLMMKAPDRIFGVS